MNIDLYQFRSTQTAIYPEKYSVMYPALGLAAEAGEVANKVKKIYRDKNGALNPQDAKEIAHEVGDVLWYLAALARDLGYELSEIAEMNITKLEDRMARGVLQGSGDNR
jgi:NTP pyrophosphatase (non-canonical NTP hydrolase)